MRGADVEKLVRGAGEKDDVAFAGAGAGSGNSGGENTTLFTNICANIYTS